ncbi:MAG: KpsF/GutQ family sugar-phosphate isomerase [Planctomycetota bacterium]
MKSSPEEIIRRGRRILDEEAKAILKKSQSLGEGFVRVVERILAVEGHVAVTGVGKSGIVGEKIAATLASTGTPAFFLKPVEALHGDLGMHCPRDLLLAISASGETAEVLAVAEAAQAIGVEVLAVTGAPESSLARKAALTLDVAVEREACPLGLAPTASTTVTLAMGDAVAMVLLEERGFTREHYLRFHPGGALGERLRFRVRDLMRRGDRIPRVRETATVREALEEMTNRDNLGFTLVVSESGKLSGILTDGDLRRALLRIEGRRAAGESTPEVLPEERVSGCMSRNPRIVDAESSAAEALRIMEVHGITSLAVVDPESRPEGVIHLHDILGRGKFHI